MQTLIYLPMQHTFHVLGALPTQDSGIIIIIWQSDLMLPLYYCINCLKWRMYLRIVLRGRPWQMSLHLLSLSLSLSLSFIHLFIYSFIHLFIHIFIHIFIHSFIPSFIHSFIYLLIHLLIHSLTHSFINIYSKPQSKPKKNQSSYSFSIPKLTHSNFN